MSTPPKPTPDFSAIKSFVEKVRQPIVERFSGRLISRSHLRGLQFDMDREWRAFYLREPGPYLLAEGCSVEGLEAALSSGRLMLRWKTQFLPGPRYDAPWPAAIPLGFHRAFDLYAAYTYPNRASVYAVLPANKVTEWHLHKHNLHPPQENAVAIKEALHRSQLVNAFFGSEFARPKPLGRAGLPVRHTQL